MNTQSNLDNQLSLDDLVKLRDNLRSLRRTIASRRRRFNRERLIGLNEYNQMIIAEDLISDWIDYINDRVFDTIFVDLQQGSTQLELAINKVNQAISELQELNKILQYINLVVGLAQNILFVATTGDVAKIAVIIDQIGQL